MLFDNIFLILFIFILNYFFFKKLNLLNENVKFSDHKDIGSSNKSPILIGGVYFFIIILIFFPNFDFITKFVFFLLTILGVMSDKNYLPNPKIRLIIQLILISILIYLQDLTVDDLRQEEINFLLEKPIVNFFFTTFCFAVLINGSNFIDGLNGLLTTYCILILLSTIFIQNNNEQIIFLGVENMLILIFSLSIFLIFNLFGKVYLGDSGSYLLSIFIGIYLIKLSQDNLILSPYYVALLLWYPAFENLFSLIRRLNKNINVSEPDKKHLHQLVYYNLDKFTYFKKKWLNLVASALIIIFIFPGFLVATFFPENSKILIFQLMLNIILYILTYYFLSKNFINKK
jgi:UDP-N-acetylmuramyl pentapeptide phosphotransferase/UDP-N-acetylglucosamine-1-phosphate transferase